MEIILASESKMKNFIFERTAIPYRKLPADIDETVCDHLPIKERVLQLSYLKCQKIAGLNPNAIVISADTISTDSEGVALSKPADAEESFNRSIKLSGATTMVYTGCTIYTGAGNYQKELAVGEIKYIDFDETTLRRLIKEDDPTIRNSLGVFSDSPGFTLIESWKGSYTGVLGLPMEFVYRVLNDLEVL